MLLWKWVFDPKEASQEWVFKLISFVMPQNFVNMVILIWRLMLDKNGKSKIWAMSRYMWPSFLKHLIDITSFILISVHNFHQIFHLKTYISNFYVHDFNWKRESLLSWISMHGSWKFSQLICFIQLSYMLKSLTQIYEKNWIDVDTNAVLRLTQPPKQLFGRQAHKDIQNTHNFTSSFSIIHGDVD